MVLGGGDRVPLADRAVVADGRSAAVVAADGTVDWWCPDGFAGPPLLWRLVDPSGAAVQLRVAGMASAPGQLTYPGAALIPSAVLAGSLEVRDVLAGGVLVRLATALRGEVDVELAIAPGWAWKPARRVEPFAGGVVFDGWAVRAAGVPCRRTGEGLVTGTTRLRAGERLVVTVGRAEDAGLSVDDAMRAFDEAERTGRRFARTALYDGPGAEEVRRSLAVLHGMHFASAATTSLPTVPGGDRQQDSRYASVRLVAALASIWDELGYRDESAAALAWLGDVVDAGFPVAPLWTVDGDEVPVEQEVPGIAGWRRSQPVVVGARREDAALHLDVLGALAPLVERLAVEHWRGLVALADGASGRWAEPNDGPWRSRSQPRHHPTTRVRVWAFLDRLVRTARARNPLDLEAVPWHHASNEAERIMGSQVPTAAPDAALLRLAWQGPWPADHELVRGIVDRVLGRLGDGPFLYRVGPDVDEGHEGVDAPSVEASFWAVRALAEVGRWDEAHDRFESLLAWGRRGPGALPRAADPARLAFLGDIPDTAAHIALINAAQAMAAGPR